MEESDTLLEGQADTRSSTVLPKGQLAILCFLRILDPMCFTQIFPYINEFMVDLHVADDPSRIGFYSGLVVSVYPAELGCLPDFYAYCRRAPLHALSY